MLVSAMGKTETYSNCKFPLYFYIVFELALCLSCIIINTVILPDNLQCDYSKQGHPTKFSTNLTNENHGG